MSKTEPIIKATNLSAGYASKVVWSDANFSVDPGEFVVILGPNGAGKTTLFRHILGLVKPVSGKLEVFSETPAKGNPRIGYVPQQRQVDEDFNIEALELVRLGINNSGWGFASPAAAIKERKRSIEALDSVDAKELAHRPLGQLSGGELQRVFLAQALVGKPDMLLLDEPLANLDIKRESELVRLIAKVAKEQDVTVLLIAHDVNPLLTTVNRIMYTVNGRVATGSLKEIITSEKLSELYGASIEVLKDSKGRLAVIGTEEGTHHV